MKVRALIAALSLLSLAGSPARGQTDPSSVPPVVVFGFANVDYVETDRPTNEGFLLGQVVGHLSAGVSERLTFFSEMTATARPDDFDFEVERAFLRYDFNDWFKLSGGRYHTPIVWWNTAYHHGLWLQTTTGRPRMIRFGSKLIPVHFLGLQAEGSFPFSPLGLGYAVGLGNGRDDIIARPADAGDRDEHRAFLGTVYARPATFHALQIGGSFYADRIESGEEIDERILTAHLVWERESPEFAAEYARVDHEPVAGGETWSTDAWYVQLAYRLPGAHARWKPYARYERIEAADEDPVFDPLGLDYDGAVVGVRYDFQTLAAMKAEYRSEQFADGERFDTLQLQVSFTFGHESDGALPPEPDSREER